MNKKNAVMVCLAVALGWFLLGGHAVVFENGKAWAQDSSAGAKLYEKRCGICHPAGGNVITPAEPVAGSSYLKTLDAFAKFNRKPVKADGTKGKMPAFPPDAISDNEMKMIYEYAKKLPPLKK